ncbi:uncharacterized protein LOC110429143 [Herrania umbratica]|uniref:Uncharacterized protein LOC110429143 n=1 Tax=Herrania umbratica TaxID=108875 RepID=A0A6J1BN12_9ROSI|nr:uncharacterized protein LOC110429143 [Herrania umbratica]
MASSEDFTFPKITNPMPLLTISPSLWRVSSLVYPECGDDDEDDGKRQVPSFQSKSFSHLGSEANKISAGYDAERMDMLWEDFNEELKRVSSLRSRRKDGRIISSRGGIKSKAEPASREPAAVELCYAQALKMSQTGIGTGMIYHKRQSNSMLAVMKTLKKFLFLRNLVSIKN